ncbi:hypothetical protein B0T17DRAFT_502965 [Bombardia bombarda]|uniref:Uncharacterized protein n=1 Tax=Bombardia bombarda TaxID=252184 RepID=A0AA39XK17_9PEZI|nr:hypothetical protein B0T17DRAFT_502965 [Bombardia bombarda]
MIISTQPPENLQAWACTNLGRSFRRIIARNLLNKLTPEDFVLNDCDDYLSKFTAFDTVDNVENGRISERVVFSVIHVCRSLFPDILAVPYLCPCQLDVRMEHSRSTAALDMYCYTRISRACFHDGPASEVCRLLGFATDLSGSQETNPAEEAIEEHAEAGGEAGDDAHTFLDDAITTIADRDTVSEDLFSSQNDCPTDPSAEGIEQCAEKIHRWPADDDLYGEHFELCHFEGVARTCESELESSVCPQSALLDFNTPAISPPMLNLERPLRQRARLLKKLLAGGFRTR